MSITNDLHNNHNVYILGAGFSRLRGLPLISDFMMQMRDALEFHARANHKRECEAISAVLDFRLKASSAAYRIQIDLENIEELFSLASASPNPIEESIRLAIAATLDYSLEVKRPQEAGFTASRDAFANSPNWQFENSQFTMPVGSWRVPAYDYIVKTMLGESALNLSGIENSFITFNYDTILENSLTSLNVPYSLGFDEHGTQRSGLGPRVLKLHGSMNWAVPKGSRTAIKVFGSYRDVVNEGLSPQLVPPTWKKDSRGAFNAIWSESLKVLSEATRVVVMGFSIPPTDLHFKYLLAAGLQNNYSLREIVFVNPGEGLNLVRNRCKELFANHEHNAAKVRFVDSTAEAFMGQGTDPFHAWSISRPVPESLQQLEFRTK